MIVCFRAFAAICAVVATTTAAMAQIGNGNADPDVYTKLKAVQVYLEDGSATLMAQACAESIPDFMSEFIPKFTSWRVANAKQIDLGARLSVQFKNEQGEPMDPTVLGHAAAEKVRSITPDERSRECGKLLRDVSAAG